MIALDARSTALVLIDLQKGILGYTLGPITGQELLARGQLLAERFRAASATVVLVNVAFSPDHGDLLRQPVDEPQALPAGGFPAGWSEFPPGLQQPGDLKITKRQWGAFHGTELDLQLRRRGIRTIVLGGVSTHIGVESTARQAYEHGYELLIVKDATSSSVSEGHEMSMKHVFPRLARLVQSADITLTAPKDLPR
jgi:nicotinamidase-related amidase